MAGSYVDIAELARKKYNATGDTFYSDQELYQHIYQGIYELCAICPLIEATDTQSTVIGTDTYFLPATAIAIKRITYDGRKLQKVTFRDLDSVTGQGQSTANGIPEMYVEWGEAQFQIYPKPSEVKNLVTLYDAGPDTFYPASAINIPTMFITRLVDFVVMQMAEKDENPRTAQRYENRWEKTKVLVLTWSRRRKRNDSMAVVLTEEQHAATQFGTV